jgi:hypothetical protein
LKIPAFDFAGANDFNQNTWGKDQEFTVARGTRDGRAAPDGELTQN